MITTTRRKEQLKPVTGTVRWLRPLIVGKQLGRISITNANGLATEYDIDAFTNGDGEIQGFGLAKDNDEIYAVDVTLGYGWQCDCADAQFRNRECKHVRGLRVALASARVVIPAPQRQHVAPDIIELDDL